MGFLRLVTLLLPVVLIGLLFAPWINDNFFSDDEATGIDDPYGRAVGIVAVVGLAVSAVSLLFRVRWVLIVAPLVAVIALLAAVVATWDDSGTSAGWGLWVAFLVSVVWLVTSAAVADSTARALPIWRLRVQWDSALVVWVGVIAAVSALGGFAIIYSVARDEDATSGEAIILAAIGALVVATPYLVVTAVLHLMRNISDSLRLLERRPSLREAPDPIAGHEAEPNASPLGDDPRYGPAGAG